MTSSSGSISISKGHDGAWRHRAVASRLAYGVLLLSVVGRCAALWWCVVCMPNPLTLACVCVPLHRELREADKRAKALMQQEAPVPGAPGEAGAGHSSGGALPDATSKSGASMTGSRRLMVRDAQL